MRPVRKRKLVDAVCGEWDVSIRRAWITYKIFRTFRIDGFFIQ